MNSHDPISPESSFINRLKTVYHDCIKSLFPEEPSTAGEYMAIERLHNLADNSPYIIVLLAGSYLDENTFDAVTDCAIVHLYARVLDDAIDENMHVNRKILLRSQPFYWRSVGRLAARFPDLWEDASVLIDETVMAVEQDDRIPSPDAWGMKNHHLLLIPMLLSGNSSSFQKNRTGLSWFLWLLQSKDELEQGRLDKLAGGFVEKLHFFLESPDFDILMNHEWRSTAGKILHESRQILESIENRNMKKDIKTKTGDLNEKNSSC